MKSLIHEIVTSLKFLYPCIAYEENSSEFKGELEILTETSLSRIYPIKKTVQGMISIGEDFWGNYCFKDENEKYYCEVDSQLYFKGNDIEGEPSYPVNKSINYEYPNLDSEISEFNPFIEKTKEYFNNHEKVELINLSVSLKNDNEIKDHKIICQFKLKIK